jgi:hypothetical protein
MRKAMIDRWNRGEMSRYAFSISPRVQLHPWFHGLEADRPYSCGCGEDYETVDHILWSSFLYQTERMQLKSQLSGEDLSLFALFSSVCWLSANGVILGFVFHT